MIAIVDYDVGNLGSILNMFKKVGANAVVTKDPGQIKSAEKILLPGIGRFDFCMKALEKSGLKNLLQEMVFEKEVPTMGICVGFQMLSEGSEEGDAAGLGWIQGVVKKFRFPEDPTIKIPHMGWNRVEKQKESSLLNDFGDEPRFYFAHSYYMETRRPQTNLLKTNYGFTFVSAVQDKNLSGVQFHPEKSHKFGMKLFKNFAEAP